MAICEGSDQLEIYHCAFLQQKYYKKNPPYIVGIAGKYDEAIELLQQMIADVFRETGDYHLKEYFLKIKIKLIDMKLEFGRTADGQIILADEISPDTCRFWDAETNKKLDKDRFRRDLGGVEEVYQEMLARVTK